VGVSRGGRPDLAGAALKKVMPPTLLIVGGEDDMVIDLNREAFGRLRCDKHLRIVPSATHLFAPPVYLRTQHSGSCYRSGGRLVLEIFAQRGWYRQKERPCSLTVKRPGASLPPP
jgi:hypothetical protein